MTKKINPSIIDDIFDGVEIPDDKTMARQVAVAKRELSGWYEKNNARLQDPEYLKKISDAQTKFYQENPDFQKSKVQSEKWKTAQLQGYREYLNSPDYVNPKGMLGKKRSKESIEIQRQKTLGVPKSEEHNSRVSQAKLGIKPSSESIEKMRQKLLGRETGRSRKVQTPAGIFEKLKDAAIYYDVTPESIKNYIDQKNVKEWFKPKLVEKGVNFDGLKPLGFKWLGDQKEELGAKKVQTPDGIFENVKAASIFYNLTTAAVRHRIKTQPNKYFFIK
jgi:hypothetical protein